MVRSLRTAVRDSNKEFYTDHVMLILLSVYITRSQDCFLVACNCFIRILHHNMKEYLLTDNVLNIFRNSN